MNDKDKNDDKTDPRPLMAVREPRQIEHLQGQSELYEHIAEILLAKGKMTTAELAQSMKLTTSEFQNLTNGLRSGEMAALIRAGWATKQPT